jgi:hypothetical protein
LRFACGDSQLQMTGPDGRQLARLLRASRVRPAGHRTAEQRDGFSPLHVPSREDHALCNGTSPLSEVGPYCDDGN